MAEITYTLSEICAQAAHDNAAKILVNGVVELVLTKEIDGSTIKFRGALTEDLVLSKIEVLNSDDEVLVTDNHNNITVVAGYEIAVSISFAPMKFSDVSPYTQQTVIYPGNAVESVIYVLISQFDGTYYDYLEITASGVTVRVWDYDDPHAVHFEADFPTDGITRTLKITDQMRGPLEIHAKGNGVIDGAILYKGIKL